MKTTINEKPGNKDYPLALVVQTIDELEGCSLGYQYNMTCRLAVTGSGSLKKVSGTIESNGMSSSQCLDDVDADDYYRQAEAQSVDAVVDFLQRKFDAKSIQGKILSTFRAAYHHEKTYKINFTRQAKSA